MEQRLRYDPRRAEHQRCKRYERRQRTLAREHRNAFRLRIGDDLRRDRLRTRVQFLAVRFKLRLNVVEFRPLGLGRRFELPQLRLFRGVGYDAGFDIGEALRDAVFAPLRNRRFLFEAIDDLGDFLADLNFEPGEIGVELAHARMARQQGRGKLRNLPLDAHALLHEILNKRRLLHVRQLIGRSERDHLAR